jgi:hypothetical protein
LQLQFPHREPAPFYELRDAEHRVRELSRKYCLLSICPR